MGRHKIEIDAEQFEKLCSLQCTLEEISNWFKCSHDTIERWCERNYGLKFNEVYQQFSVQGKVSLRRYQFRMAEKNVTMAIWLGKQWLGQKDGVVQLETENGQLEEILSFMKLKAKGDKS